jgi:pimeloyl-ACP methyl ester carboxylesterase
VPAPVVLLPSLGRPASDFDTLAASLRRAGFDPMALDPPPSAPVGSSLLDLADEVLARLSSRDVGSFHLIGHAFGNRLSRAVTATAPDRVESLTLLAAGGYVEMADEVATALLDCFRLAMGSPEHLSAVARAFFAPGHDPAVWAGGWMADVARYQMAAVAATDRAAWWDAVAPRVLVVQALQDAVAPVENGRRYAADHPREVTLVEIDGAGHALIVERPDEVARAVVGFLGSD